MFHPCVQGSFTNTCAYVFLDTTSTCLPISILRIENIRQTTNHLNNVKLILTMFVSDSDSNEESLQEENREEDESEEVATHNPQGTIKSYCFTYIKISTYQFYYLPNESTDTHQKYSKNIYQSFKKLYYDIDNFRFRFQQLRTGSSRR